MKVKVCGITSYEDAAMALDLGVDALGFNFYAPSPRYIDPGAARSIIRRLPPFSIAVGVFVNVANSQEVDATARAASVQVLQLHGDESPAYCRGLNHWRLIKALRPGAGNLAEDVERYPVQCFLLDAADERLYGGTGRTFDWTLAHNVNAMKRPVVLAGGLRAENVRAAIEAVRPYAVDVCSGVETSPGKKDAVKLKEFLDEIRRIPEQRSAELRA